MIKNSKQYCMKSIWDDTQTFKYAHCFLKISFPGKKLPIFKIKTLRKEGDDGFI